MFYHQKSSIIDQYSAYFEFEFDFRNVFGGPQSKQVQIKKFLMLEVTNPDYKQRIESYLNRQMFMKHVGIRLTEIEPGEVIAELDIDSNHEQQFGRVHGGVISTIADISSGFAAYTLVPVDSHVVTGEIKISYLGASRKGKLKAIGRVIKAGRKISFCESEVFNVMDGEEKLVAKASTSMVIIPLSQE